MAQRTDELRKDIEERRSSITHTVDEIENRVHPGHVAARNTYKVRRRFASLKDNIMGSENDYGNGGVMDRVKEAPETVTRKTRGNPLAAGAIAVGAGALMATLLPPTRQEQRLVEKIQPELEGAMSEVTDAGREMASEAADVARESVSHLTESAKAAGEDLMDEAKGAKNRVMDQGTGEPRG